jgi:hypothetical protein
LGTRLEDNESDTFGGLWVQHEPDYRVELYVVDPVELGAALKNSAAVLPDSVQVMTVKPLAAPESDGKS